MRARSEMIAFRSNRRGFTIQLRAIEYARGYTACNDFKRHLGDTYGARWSMAPGFAREGYFYEAALECSAGLLLYIQGARRRDWSMKL